MNGGVLHAVECLSASELSDAQSGCRFFGFGAVASLLDDARKVLDAGENLEFHEGRLDKEYAEIIPTDSCLVRKFEEHFNSYPSDFSPLRTKDTK
jgi:hypothetical protein